MSKWLRTGDKVVVRTGNDRGKTGKVLRLNKKRIVVEGVNLRKKHMRRTQELPQGQILTFEGSIHRSNVQPCNDSGQPVRLRVRDTDKGKELVYRQGGSDLVYRTVSQAR